MKPSFYFNATCNFYDLSDYSVIAYNLIRFQIIQAFLQKDIVFPLDFLDIIFICVLQNFQFFSLFIVHFLFHQYRFCTFCTFPTNWNLFVQINRSIFKIPVSSFREKTVKQVFSLRFHILKMLQ